jgi:hypothetical protein
MQTVMNDEVVVVSVAGSAYEFFFVPLSYASFGWSQLQ